MTSKSIPSLFLLHPASFPRLATIAGYRAQAKAGNVTAQILVSKALFDHNEAATSAEGLQWLQVASKQSDEAAQTLALCVLDGDHGAKKNAQAAYRELVRLSNTGRSNACYWRAHCLYHGLGTAKNRTEALEFYKLASKGLDAAIAASDTEKRAGILSLMGAPYNAGLAYWQVLVYLGFRFWCIGF